MSEKLSIHLKKHRSRRYIKKQTRKGFLLMEAMLTLIITMIFSIIIMQMRTQITLWHTEARQYLRAVSIVDRVVECIQLKKSIPEKIDVFHISIQSKPDEQIPYTMIAVTIAWKTPHNQDKAITLYTGLVNET